MAHFVDKGLNQQDLKQNRALSLVNMVLNAFPRLGLVKLGVILGQWGVGVVQSVKPKEWPRMA